MEMLVEGISKHDVMAIFDDLFEHKIELDRIN
jgi:hypothetical protein